MRISRHANEDTRRKWIKSIPKQKFKSFNFKSCYLCDAHFEPQFIRKTRQVVRHDNKEVIAEEPLKVWNLTDDAYPTVFSNQVILKYFDKKCPTRGPPTVRNPPKNVTNEVSAHNRKVSGKQEYVILPSESEKESTHLDFLKELKSLTLPSGWFATYSDNQSCANFCKLVEDTRTTKASTFHSEKSVKVYTL